MDCDKKGSDFFFLSCILNQLVTRIVSFYFALYDISIAYLLFPGVLKIQMDSASSPMV